MNKKMGTLLIGMLFFITLLNLNIKEEAIEVIQQTKQTKQIYLLHDNELLLVEYDTFKTTIEEQIEEVIQFMKQDIYPFSNLLNETTTISSIQVENSVCTIDFEILDYDKENELRLLEALIFSLTSDSSIDFIELKLKSETLTMMPLSNTLITYNDRNYGINHLSSNNQYLHDYENVFLIQNKSVEGMIYQYVQSIAVYDKYDYDNYFNLICDNITYLINEKIKADDIVLFDTESVILFVNKYCLDENKQVKEEFINVLQANFSQFDDLNYIQIVVDGQLMSVNGMNKLMIRRDE